MKPLKLEEISSLIKEQIANYKTKINTTEIGTVIKVTRTGITFKRNSCAGGSGNLP